MADYKGTTSGTGGNSVNSSQNTPKKSEQSKNTESKTAQSKTLDTAKNQSDKALEKKEKKRAKRDRRKKRRRVRRIILSYLLVIFILVFVIGGYYVYERFGKDFLVYRDEAIELVADSSPDTFRQDETSIVYDANGKKLRGGKRRERGLL